MTLDYTHNNCTHKQKKNIQRIEQKGRYRAYTQKKKTGRENVYRGHALKSMYTHSGVMQGSSELRKWLQ